MSTGLTTAHLTKYSGDSEKSRTKKIFEMIRDGKPFEMLDTSKTVLAKKVKLEFIAGYVPFFKTDSPANLASIANLTGSQQPIFHLKGNPKITYKLNQLYKSPTDFGGGKGSGGGAAETAINESLQCFYSSILFNTSATKLSDKKPGFSPTMEDLKAQIDYCHTQASATGTVYTASNFEKQLYDKAPPSWIKIDEKLGTNVYMRIANTLYKSATTKPLRNFQAQGIHFHRGSPFMSAIYAARKRCWDAQDGLSAGKSKAPASGLQNDKWNPGDIWVSSLDPIPTNSNPLCFVDTKHSSCQDWDALKDHVLIDAKGLRHLIKDGKGKPHTAGATLAVSLKKVGETPRVESFNGGTVSAQGKSITHIRTQNKDVTYKGFVFGQTGNFFSSADCYLHFDDGIMQLRSTDGTKSWQGEVKGGFAGGGKIGGGGLNYFCEKVLGKSIGFSSKQGVGDWSEKRVAQNIYELYKKYNKLQMKPEKGGGFKDFYSSNGKNKAIVKIKVDKKPNPYEGKNGVGGLSKANFELLGEGDKERGYNSKFKSYAIKANSTAASKGFVSEDDFKILADNYINNKGQKSDAAFYFSKNMCLLFLDAVYVNGNLPSNIKEFATKIKRYAMSNIENISTYFIKIM